MAHIQQTYSGLWKPQNLTIDKIISQKMFIDNIDITESFILSYKTNINTSVDTVVILRTINTTDTTLFITNKLVFVKSNGWYYYDRTSVSADNGTSIIAPTTGGGRWLKVADDRSFHTGTQTASTISDFATTVRGSILTGLSTATSTVASATDTILVAIGKLQAQITLRATLAAPTFTGIPAAPTASAGTNTTQLATTAFVNGEIANDAVLLTHKGIANGVASLDASGYVTSTQFNYATQLEVETGTENTKILTPLRVFQAIAKWVSVTTIGTLGTLTNSTILATDTIKSALEKLQGQVNNKENSISTDLVTKFWAGTKVWRDLATDVRAVVLTGVSVATATAITATDSILVALGKLQGQIDNKEASITADLVTKFWSGTKTWRDLATDVRASVLTGLSLATSTVISAADTILVALGKLQAQISLKADLNNPVPFITTTGTLPSYVATVTGITLTAGAQLCLKIHATNTATANTLNVNALGAKGIKFQGQDVAIGMLLINSIVPVVYDGTYWQIQSLDSAYQFIPSTAGTGAIYTATMPGYTSYITGMIIPIKFTLANTSATPTINVNSLGAKTIQRNGSALTIGEICALASAFISYDGTNFQVFGIGDTGANLLLTGYSKGAVSTDIVATDTVDVAFGKVANKIDLKEGSITAGTVSQFWAGTKAFRDLATDVRASVLTGLDTSTNAVISTTDSVLTAFGKLQKQITDKATTADITYYVATTGSDSNNGLAVGTPFLTIAKAVSMIPQTVNHIVTINVAAGTYAEIVYLSGYNGMGAIDLKGGTDATTALNYIVDNIIVKQSSIAVTVTGFIAVSTIYHAFETVGCIRVTYKYCITTVSALGYRGFNVSSSKITTQYCKCSNHGIALCCWANSDVYSMTWDVGSGNTTGTQCNDGSKVSKNGVQPQGTTLEVAQGGGMITSSVLNPAPMRTPTLLKSTSYTLALADEGTKQKCLSASAIVVTIPTDAVLNLPIDYELFFLRYGTGTVTFDNTGVTLNSPSSKKAIKDQFGMVTLVKIAANEWTLGGSLE